VRATEEGLDISSRDVGEVLTSLKGMEVAQVTYSP
jgi:hypothetical protein